MGEPPAGERVLHLEMARFDQQLEVLTEMAQVVPLAQILSAPASPEDPRPRVAITWDDAYHGAVTMGLDAVVKRRLAATVFVSPGLLGGHAFWWDRVAMAHGGSVPAGLRERILNELAGDDEIVDAGAVSLPPATAVPAWARSTDQGTLVRSASRPGITIASHSWSHPNMEAVSQDRLDDELSRPLRWFAEKIPEAQPWLALPYGLGSTTTRHRAAELGYAAVFQIRGGWLPSGTMDATALPRLNVPAGLSTDGFVLRLRGIFCR
jgi:peptidoglycan/xylan/chitin deacetylase (PgdA/CDA1 family)